MPHMLRNWLLLVSLLCLGALLAACPSQAPSLDEAPAVSGRVVFPGDASFSTQAAITDVASAATVVLIDTTANITRGATITDSNGNFLLRFSNGFRPTASASYYLEAVRGLGNNAAGKNAARVRTILRYEGGWQSLTSSLIGNPIYINLGTTAVSTIVSLKGSSRVNVNQVIGTLSADGETFSPVTGISGTEFTTVKGFASTLLLADADPLAGISYDPGPPEAFAQRAAGGMLSIDEATASIGQLVTLRGISFNPTLPLTTNNVVLFNNTATGSVTGISGDRQSITVVVPNDAVSGPVTVRTGARIFGVPSFTVWSNLNVDLF